VTSRDFCFWLQGFFEIDGAMKTGIPRDQLGLTNDQVDMIKKHLALVFVHEIDPAMGDKIHQDLLSSVHSPERVEINKLREELEKLKNRKPQYVPPPVMKC
jgi:hypothetical protein